MAPLTRLPDLPGALCAQIGVALADRLFFPEKGGTYSAARGVCQRCPELDACREWALVNREGYGMWGATTEDDRRAVWAPATKGRPRLPRNARESLSVCCPECLVVTKFRATPESVVTCPACRHKVEVFANRVRTC